MVLVVLTPGLSRGAHEIKVQNVRDLIGNSIIQNGIDNILSFMVYPPTGLTEGPVFTDPFSDGTDFSMFTKYDSKIYLGTNNESAKLFEMNYGMNTINTILLDADGTVGSPIQDFDGYGSLYRSTIYGIDAIYSACADWTSTPDLTGPACSAAGGTETMFIGGLNTAGYYDSYWITNDVSTTSATFTFSEQQNPDVNGGTYAYRSTVFTLFKDQLWNHFGAENGGGGRGGRVCMKATGCNDGTVFLSGVQLSYITRIKRIGADLTNNSLSNGSSANNTFGGQVPAESRVLNAINVSYEHDNDGTGGNESQLYIANGGFYAGPLGSPRTGSSDGGIVRTTLAYSTRSSLPLNCPVDTSGCSTYWEDVTPDTISDWNSFVSIMLPQNSNVTGAANCGTSSIEMDCVVPYNTFTPSMKAIPYMRTAPNGDLYMLRNACSSQIVCLNGKADCDFRTVKQTCLPGSEVPQLWMMPKNCGTAADCSTKWKLVAEYDTTGKSTMQGNIADCGTAPNKCHGNTQATLLEFVGNYLYIGFDNPTYGINLWRTDMSAVISGNIPAEASFDLVSDFGFDATLTNTKIFNHITFYDSSRDWLLISTGNGVVPVKVYRTSNTTE
jgi:hypothetical protein